MNVETWIHRLSNSKLLLEDISTRPTPFLACRAFEVSIDFPGHFLCCIQVRSAILPLWSSSRCVDTSRLLSISSYLSPVSSLPQRATTQSRYLSQLRLQNNIIVGKSVLLLHYVGMLLLRSGSTGELSLLFLSLVSHHVIFCFMS